MNGRRRYVVLLHTPAPAEEPSHYDLLVDAADDAPLLTWRLERWPPRPGEEALRQPDHRRLYLEYEGEISGRRGQVRRVAAGECDAQRAGDIWRLRWSEWRLQLEASDRADSPAAEAAAGHLAAAARDRFEEST